MRVLKTLYELIRGAETVDLLISNFVYEKQGATRQKGHAGTDTVFRQTRFSDGMRYAT